MAINRDFGTSKPKKDSVRITVKDTGGHESNHV